MEAFVLDIVARVVIRPLRIVGIQYGLTALNRTCVG